MAIESHAVALREAADLLGVSVQQLEQRIEAGELPEASENDQGSFVIERAHLAVVAQREGWIIDLRDDETGPSPEFSEMLERLLGLGQQLIEETSARNVAESALERANDDLAAARRENHELESVIEELDAENMRLGKDLADVTQKMLVGDAVAKERFDTILDLQASIDSSQRAHQIDLEHHRRTEHDLRDRVEKAQASMGWWSKRRFRKLP